MKGYPVVLIFDRWVPHANVWMRCKCRFASLVDMHQYINKHKPQPIDWQNSLHVIDFYYE